MEHLFTSESIISFFILVVLEVEKTHRDYIFFINKKGDIWIYVYVCDASKRMNHVLFTF